MLAWDERWQPNSVAYVRIAANQDLRMMMIQAEWHVKLGRVQM